jgi:hypothetical protein
MSDLIARLRDWSEDADTDKLCQAAAAEIEALRSDVARLKAALSWLYRWIGHKSLKECADKVRDAQAGKAGQP